MRVVPIIVNYNMPERADALAKKLEACPDTSVVLVDNGSDITKVADNTTVILPKNVQTTGGWLAGVDIATKMYKDIFAFMFVITSAKIISDDIVSPMAKILLDDDNAVGVHPALTKESTTSWKQLITRDTGNRKTWMIDNICSMYSADWWLNHKFDPRMIYAWGIDLETCYFARKEGRSIWVCEDVLAEKITNIGYDMDRMNMTSRQRHDLALANMCEVMFDKYGMNWRWHMKKEFITDEMQ
jgi:hypothetical protein